MAGDQNLTADGVRRLAVIAAAGVPAGSVQIEAHGIDGSGFGTSPLIGVLGAADSLIHADDVQNVAGAVAHGGQPIRHSVNIDHRTVFGDGVGAGEEVIGAENIVHDLILFLRRRGHIPVQRNVVALAGWRLSDRFR